MGANVYEGLGYEMAFVVDPQGGTAYSVIKGVPQRSDALDFLPEGLDGLIEASRTQGTTVVGLLGAGPDVLMAAADVILPPSFDRGAVDPETLSTLIFVKKLDRAFLSRMGDEYLLENLEIVRQADPGRAAAVPLTTPTGEAIGHLTWTPATPGYEMLRLLLPPLSVAILILATLSWLVVGQRAPIDPGAGGIDAHCRVLRPDVARERSPVPRRRRGLLGLDLGMRSRPASDLLLRPLLEGHGHRRGERSREVARALLHRRRRGDRRLGAAALRDP